MARGRTRLTTVASITCPRFSDSYIVSYTRYKDVGRKITAAVLGMYLLLYCTATEQHLRLAYTSQHLTEWSQQQHKILTCAQDCALPGVYGSTAAIALLAAVVVRVLCCDHFL